LVANFALIWIRQSRLIGNLKARQANECLS